MNLIILIMTLRIYQNYDNVVPTKKAKVHTWKVCEPWYNILRDQKTKVHKKEMIWQKYNENHEWLAFQMERSKYFRMLSVNRQQFTVIGQKN